MKRFLLAVLLLACVTTTTPAAVKKIAVILFVFQNATDQPYTALQMKGVVFTNPSSAAAMYNEMSFGNLTLEGALSSQGDVFGWYTIPYTTDANCSTFLTIYTAAARTLAESDGFVFSNYDAIIYGFSAGGGCGGLTGFAGHPGTVYIPLSTLPTFGTIVHELGHAFGRQHANAYDCVNSAGTRVAISNSCTIVPYGNPFSSMGQYSLHGHFNVYEKNRDYTTPIWIEDPNITTVTAAGNFTIYPLEESSLNPQAIKIDRGAGTYYLVEFRKTFGFDDFSYIASNPGVLIYIAGSGETFLLDATPNTDTFFDAALAQGQTFTDSVQGVTITATTINGTTNATLAVSFSGGACTARSPNISVSPATQTGDRGETLTYTVVVTNPNLAACGSSTYTVVPKVPSGWVASPTSRTETLGPGASVSRSFTVTSKTSARAGTYVITQKATSTSNKRLNALAQANYVVP